MKRKLIWNDDSGYVEPKVIMATVMILIIFVIAIFLVGLISNLGNVYNPQDENSLVGGRFSGTLDVTDPSVDQCWNIGVDGTMETVRQVLTDGTILTIDTGNWSYIDPNLCVTSDGLWG